MINILLLYSEKTANLIISYLTYQICDHKFGVLDTPVCVSWNGF